VIYCVVYEATRAITDYEKITETKTAITRSSEKYVAGTTVNYTSATSCRNYRNVNVSEYEFI